ncbi:MAG TPA: hypothetical protein VHW05_06115 [Phenylobacterium sp.]|jgi:hypothetical protein|nr:hypothetical protein [Phenylobacterium sp.]
MFAGWDSFYLMIGGAAGALIGLLFVVATLTGGLGADKAQLGAKIYLTPTVFHFAVVLTVSAITAVPRLGAEVSGGLLAAAALLGLIYSLNVGRMLRGPVHLEAPHWTDFWCYAAAPGVTYLAQIAAAYALARGLPWAQDALAAALIGLLLITIRNAWDLVTTIAPIANGKP